MAKMYPPEIRRNVKSKAEHFCFSTIKLDLDDQWIVLHSLGLIIHESKPWAEIDFVLIGPPGIFCLEVKGGRIEFKNGLWHFTDGEDNITVKHQGPFEQVGSASAALRKYLIAKLPSLGSTLMGYGVITPNIEWKIEGPDLEPLIVYDERDRTQSFSVYVQRLIRYWREWIQRHLGYQSRGLTLPECQEVLRELRADFDLRPSLRSRVDEAVDELITLTREQYRVLDELSDNERVLVRGSAGTGKTLLAIEEARRNANQGKKVFLCCFNRNLSSILREAVKDCSGIDTFNLHAFMADIIDRAGLKDRLRKVREQDLFAIDYPILCQEGMLMLDFLQPYDVLIVDEAQDILRDTYFEVLDTLVKGGLKYGKWKMFLDPFQDVFGGIDPKILTQINDFRPAQYRLSINCRNTNPIAIVTQILSGMGNDQILKIEGPEVEQYWYRDERDELRLVSRYINRLLSEKISASEIVLLSPYRRENSCIRNGLIDVPYPLVDIQPNQTVPMKAINFATIDSFKGLESKAVVVIDIDKLGDYESGQTVYLGCSRAMALLSVFLSENLKTEYSNLAHEYGEKLVKYRHGKT